ncbi:hypothetical protein [Nocardia blacklockiae]|uniref:hypothetical protein n=1 Tax=Nocardia blacklockiae TaxID=480036 RepID=UPI001894B2F5|nr:hypothetical protein [Nocardia blacklockiae]MBF6176121.1 hypothetical protein [Nocardia blacklockiae]
MSVGCRVLGIAEGLSSWRSYTDLRDLRRRFDPHSQLPEDADFRQQVRQLTIRQD